MFPNERQLYQMIATFMQMEYPQVVYRFDLAADIKLTAGQARKHKKLHPRRGYPDLFIAKRSGDYAGLFIEIKAYGNSPFKKNGALKKDGHLEEQQAMLDKLQDEGYKAVFATGFDEIVATIRSYFND